MNKKKIALIVLSAVVAAFALLVAYLSFAENPLFFSGKSELEVISGNWPPPQMPPAPNVPPKILSGSTTGVVKEVRIDKKKFLPNSICRLLPEKRRNNASKFSEIARDDSGRQ